MADVPLYSGFLNCPWPQLPASHSNRSQKLNPSSYLTHSPTTWLAPCRLSLDRLTLLVSQPVKLLLAFASTAVTGISLLEIHDKDFYSLKDMYVFQNGASSLTKEGPVFLCRCYICCTIVSAWVYMWCHNILVTMDSVPPLPLHCTK
jgi:hypothetical protein